MKILAILLILFGPAIAVGSAVYAKQESRQRQDAFFKAESESGSIARIERSMQMLQSGLVPAYTVVDPWPGILVGIGCSAFGILLLAILGSALRAGTISRSAPRDESTTGRRRLWSMLARGRQAIKKNIALTDRSQPIPRATVAAPPPWEKKL
jgi:hypothetical protein